MIYWLKDWTDNFAIKYNLYSLLSLENWRVGEVEQYVWVFPDLLLVPRVATQALVQDFLSRVDEKAGSFFFFSEVTFGGVQLLSSTEQ